MVAEPAARFDPESRRGAEAMAQSRDADTVNTMLRETGVAVSVPAWADNILNGNPPGPMSGDIDEGTREALEGVAAAYRAGGTRVACEALDAVCRADPSIAALLDDTRPVGSQSHDDCRHDTDLGNAQRLVASYGDDFRYCKPLGGWVRYDGKRWASDDDGAVERAAKATVTAMYVEAGQIDDGGRRVPAVKWALASESGARIDAMVKLAQTEAKVVARADVFDADPWALNVENGTIDLHSGVLRPHRRADYITKLAPVVYDEDATNETLDRFLDDATNGDAAFRDYLQRAAGYTLAGVTSEEDVFLLLGPGGSGKSTFVEMMLAVLGEYGAKAQFATFLTSRSGASGGNARPDLVAMRGTRLVVASEPDRTRRIDAALVKELSGGDSITARALWAPLMTFQPTFTIWLAANAAPAMPDDDLGLWRRLKTLPFDHAVPESRQDADIKRRLTSTPEGRAAVLAWAVAGCLAWQSAGRLKPPSVVNAATGGLRAQFDPLAEFFDEQCSFEASAQTPAQDLRSAYQTWADAQGAKPINNVDWSSRLKARGCESRRDGTPKQTRWYGVRLQDAATWDTSGHK